MSTHIKRLVLGKPRDIGDARTFHSISLVALLAWVGLGADGLSSSAYGPDEAFRALGQHTYLAVALALATAVTVLVISVAYSQIIRRFPYGGGGYVVASELLGPRWGVLSGSALLVDYVLTVSVSIAAAADATFSFLPSAWVAWKLPLEFASLHFHVSEPFCPGAGMGVQLQMRPPFDARNAVSDGLAPPLSPEPSPMRTMPLT